MHLPMPCTTRAQPSLPINQNPNPTPPDIYAFELHDTAAPFWCKTHVARVLDALNKILTNLLQGCSALCIFGRVGFGWGERRELDVRRDRVHQGQPAEPGRHGRKWSQHHSARKFWGRIDPSTSMDGQQWKVVQFYVQVKKKLGK